MKRSQTIQLSMSEIRSAMGELLDKENSTDEDRAKLKELSGKLSGLELSFRSALQIEEQEDRSAADGTGNETPEDREYRSLVNRSSFRNYIREAMDSKPVQGPEAELRSEVLGPNAELGRVPFEMLLPTAREVEHRADAVTSIGASLTTAGSRATVIERVFTQSIAAGLGVAMPSVPVGEAVWPVMTAGTTAAQKAKDALIESVAATFALTTLSPVRLTARYLFRVEDMAAFPALEETLRRDIRRELSDEMDDQIINGDGNAPNVEGLFDALTDAVAPGAVVDFASYISTFATLVDGISAYGIGDIAGVIGSDTYGKVAGTFNNNGDESAADYVNGKSGGIRVTSRIAAQTAGKIQQGIAVRNSYPGTNAVAPVWNAFDLIRDPYSGAAKGQVSMTAIALWNFKVLREDAWKQIAFKLSA